MGDDGVDEQCRWCGQGGKLIGCDFCHNAFCKFCIKSNLGRDEFTATSGVLSFAGIWMWLPCWCFIFIVFSVYISTCIYQVRQKIIPYRILLIFQKL